MDQISIFVVIVTYNGLKWIDDCLKSFQKSILPVTVLVVDNASTDSTVEYIEANFKDILLIKLDKNIGFGQANNVGMKIALEKNADYVFLINQDAWILPDTLSKLLLIHQQNLHYGILCPMQLNKELTHIESSFINYVDNSAITDKALFNDLYFNRLKDIYPTDYINAAAWLLPRNTITTVGGFDPLFFLYGEDDNYIQRAHYHKIEMGVCPACRVVHDTENRDKKYKPANQNEKKYLLIRFTNVNKESSVISYFLVSGIRSLKLLFLGKITASKMLFENAYYIFKLRKKIIHSISLNKTKGLNWL